MDNNRGERIMLNNVSKVVEELKVRDSEVETILNIIDKAASGFHGEVREKVRLALVKYTEEK